MKKFGKFLLVLSILTAAVAGVYLYLRDKGLLPCSCNCEFEDDNDDNENRSYVSLDKEANSEEFENMSDSVVNSESDDADTVEEFFDDAKESKK